jgi:hypothetical protein
MHKYEFYAVGLRVLVSFNSKMQKFESCRPSQDFTSSDSQLLALLFFQYQHSERRSAAHSECLFLSRSPAHEHAACELPQARA